MKIMSRLGFVIVFFLTVAGISGCPPNPPDPGSDPPQAILDMEQQAFDLVNAQRVAAGLPALLMDAAMRKMARAYSEDMIARNFFSHTDPDGHGLADRMAADGITYTIAGENIAWNSYPDPAQTAVDGWMASTGHRENILRPQFTLTGMGVATDGAGAYYFTQEFVGRGKELEIVTIYCPGPIARLPGGITLEMP